MARKKLDNTIALIKKHLEDKKVILGTKETLKHLKLGGLKTVFVSSNAPALVKQDVDYYQARFGVEVVHLDKANDELGVICRKPYAISVLSVKE